MQSTLLTLLPSETLLQIFSFLNVEELHTVGRTCRKLREIATVDELWRPIVQACLEKSPPVRSANISSLTKPPPPWDPSFGLVSADRNPANRDTWFAVPPGSESEKEENEFQLVTLLHRLFPSAESYHQVYWIFVHRLYKLLGWWLGDSPSYGMIIRVVFDPEYRGTIEKEQEPNAAFICEKIHLVNRLQGMGSSALRSPWMEATSFDSSSFRGRPSIDGTTIETDRLSIDVSVPGIKTERLWVASWNDCRQMDPSKVALGTDLAGIAWQGGLASGGDHLNRNDPAILGPRGQSSIVSRARALATQMVFGESSREARTERERRGDGMDLDEDDPLQHDDDENLPDVGPGVFGHGLTISAIVAASAVDAFENGDFDHIPHSLRTIQQRSGNQIHTVFLSSGAIYTTPASDLSLQGKERGKRDRLSIRCEKHKPYLNADTDKNRAFGVIHPDHMPLPPIDFPPPALLPLIREMNPDDSPSRSESVTTNPSSSSAYERFLDQGTHLELDILRMEPSPPYRPWPHLSQPQPSGLRFFPIRSPPRQPVQTNAIRSGQGENVSYLHTLSIPRRVDPGSSEFNWNSLQGLYGMTYGPWGLELIYIRSRLLTIHDFEPNDDVVWEEGVTLPRPTGPHGPGHTFKSNGSRRNLKQTLHWKAEPYIDVADLQMTSEETEFIKPGCRVIEGVKCSGDANVPRGTISFRAFSRGQDEDACLLHYPPGPQWANFPPWDGKGVNQRETTNKTLQQSPGRILDCATGRLAMEGFVNAGCWKRCSVKITSSDEVQVYWEALRKVAVCKRLTAC